MSGTLVDLWHSGGPHGPADIDDEDIDQWASRLRQAIDQHLPERFRRRRPFETLRMSWDLLPVNVAEPKNDVHAAALVQEAQGYKDSLKCGFVVSRKIGNTVSWRLSG